MKRAGRPPQSGPEPPCSRGREDGPGTAALSLFRGRHGGSPTQPPPGRPAISPARLCCVEVNYWKRALSLNTPVVADLAARPDAGREDGKVTRSPPVSGPECRKRGTPRVPRGDYGTRPSTRVRPPGFAVPRFTVAPRHCVNVWYRLRPLHSAGASVAAGGSLSRLGPITNTSRFSRTLRLLEAGGDDGRRGGFLGAARVTVSDGWQAQDVVGAGGRRGTYGCGPS